MGIQRAEVERVLESVGFGGEMRGAAISSLSGGWKMKLALGAGCRHPPDCCTRTPDSASDGADPLAACQGRLRCATDKWLGCANCQDVSKR